MKTMKPLIMVIPWLLFIFISFPPPFVFSYSSPKIFKAIRHGQYDRVKTLVSQGCDVNSRLGPGLTAYNYSVMMGQDSISIFLKNNGADLDIPVPEEQQLVDFIMERAVNNNTPGAVLLIAKDFNIIHYKAYGYSNLELQVPMQTNNRFRLGGFSKLFIAAAILKLQEKGRLNLEDPVSKYVEDFPNGEKIKIKHLLSHTSGLFNYTERIDFFSNCVEIYKPDDLFRLFKNEPLRFKPGTDTQYNNSGYVLLGLIIEKVTGLAYYAYLDSIFFNPLKMTDTGVHHWEEILANEVTGYSFFDHELKRSMYEDMSRFGAAGSYYSTAGDIFTWLKAFLKGDMIGDNLAKKSMECFYLEDGKPAYDKDYEVTFGNGWWITTIRGLMTIEHPGGSSGSFVYFGYFPQFNFMYLMITNCMPPNEYLPTECDLLDIPEIYLWKFMKKR